MKPRLALIAALALAIFAGPAAAAGGGGPRVVRALLEKGDRGNTSGYSLSANVKRADSVSFRTGYAGDRATGLARYNDHVTTTDLHGEASHPWRLRRNEHGKAVIRLIRASLNARGHAVVSIRMLDEGGDLHKQRIDFALSECHMDPPLYPLTCTVNNPD